MYEERLKLACEQKLPNFLLAVVFFTISALFYIYPCMWLLSNLSMAVPIIQTVFFISCCVNYLVCIYMDPGILCRDPDNPNCLLEAEEVTINGTTFVKKWCQVCRLFRPPRCRHCFTCNVCVENLDHHCAIINTCIGKRNYRFFFLLLFSLVFFNLLMLGFCLTYVFLNTHEHYTIEKIVTLILLCLSGILSSLVISFFGFHCYLVATGKSTYEQYIGVYKLKRSPFSHGCLKNFQLMLLSPLPASHVKSIKKTQKINNVQGQTLYVVSPTTAPITGSDDVTDNTVKSTAPAIDTPTPSCSIINLTRFNSVASLSSSSRGTGPTNPPTRMTFPGSFPVSTLTNPFSVIPLKTPPPEADPNPSLPVTALTETSPGNAMIPSSALPALTDPSVIVAMSEPFILPGHSIVISLNSPPSPVTAHTIPSAVFNLTCSELSVPSFSLTLQNGSSDISGPI